MVDHNVTKECEIQDEGDLFGNDACFDISFEASVAFKEGMTAKEALPMSKSLLEQAAKSISNDVNGISEFRVTEFREMVAIDEKEERVVTGGLSTHNEDGVKRGGQLGPVQLSFTIIGSIFGVALMLFAGIMFKRRRENTNDYDSVRSSKQCEASPNEQDFDDTESVLSHLSAATNEWGLEVTAKIGEVGEKFHESAHFFFMKTPQRFSINKG